MKPIKEIGLRLEMKFALSPALSLRKISPIEPGAAQTAPEAKSNTKQDRWKHEGLELFPVFFTFGVGYCCFKALQLRITMTFIFFFSARLKSHNVGGT